MNVKYKNLAIKFLKRHYSDKLVEIERLTTGLCHYVYKVRFQNGDECVIRVGSKESAALIRSGIYWNRYLAKYDLPIPQLFHCDETLENPYMIIEKLPGLDLHFVYDELTSSEKRKLARDIVAIQAKVSQLKPNDCFGYAEKYGDENLSENSSWKDIVVQSIIRSKRRIAATKIFEFTYPEQLLNLFDGFEEYFEGIKPTPFLDDITNKNVLIEKGQLAGICDIDELCFGDKLQHLALTRMALISQKSDLDYIQFFIDAYKLSREELRVLDFYTLVCCLDFMSEIGQRFNRDEIPSYDSERVVFLKSVFEKYYNKIV